MKKTIVLFMILLVLMAFIAACNKGEKATGGSGTTQYADIDKEYNKYIMKLHEKLKDVSSDEKERIVFYNIQMHDRANEKMKEWSNTIIQEQTITYEYIEELKKIISDYHVKERAAMLFLEDSFFGYLVEAYKKNTKNQKPFSELIGTLYQRFDEKGY